MSLPENITDGSIPWQITFAGGTVLADVATATDGSLCLIFPTAVMAKYRDEPFAEGEQLKAEVLDETGIYFLSLSIRALLGEQDEALWFTCSGVEVDRIQRRDAFRVKVLLEANIHSGADLKQRSEGLVRDLSETGLGVWCRFLSPDCEPGAIVKAEFFASSLGNMALEGEVRWKRPCSLKDCMGDDSTDGLSIDSSKMQDSGGYQLGLQLVNVSEGVSEHIRQYLWQLQLERRRRLNG